MFYVLYVCMYVCMYVCWQYEWPAFVAKNEAAKRMFESRNLDILFVDYNAATNKRFSHFILFITLAEIIHTYIHLAHQYR